MAFTPSFSVSQTVGLPSYVNLADTSTGSDAAIISRRVYFTTGYNTYLVSSGNSNQYESWALAQTSKSFNVLDKDYATNVVVQWLNVSGTVLYTASSINGFTLYNEQFAYDLTQSQTSEPNVIADTTYYENKIKLREEIDSGNQAVTLASDIAGAQGCYDRATFLRLNADFSF